MMTICFLPPKGPQARSAPGGEPINYDNDDNNDNDDDDNITGDDDMFSKKLQWSDKRCFIASGPLLQGMEKVGLLAVKLVLNLSLPPI